MTELPEALLERAQARKSLHLWRTLSTHKGIDFTSNDYLGFATDPELRARFETESKIHPLTASGSRLLRGELELYSDTETICANFSGQTSALLYPSGYQANLGLLSALLTPQDHVFSDELNHASLIDGMKLSGAKKHVYRHCDLNDLEARLNQIDHERGLKLIVSESIFSMDGTLAPLLGLVALAKKHGGYLIVDEAHATGLWGSGWVQTLGLNDQVLATTHTAGKALGASGAWVACGSELKEYLIQFSRGFIYSTAPFPLQTLLIKHSILHWHQVGERRASILLDSVNQFQASLSFPFAHVKAPIFPLILGDTVKTLNAAQALQASGFDVRAIRPPTVAEGSARLRIILHWQNSESEKKDLAHALNALFKKEADA